MLFSEKDFYLNEFRSRSIGIVLPDAHATASSSLADVLDEFARNRTRVLLLSHDRSMLETLAGGAVLDASDERWVGGLWRALVAKPSVGLCVAPPAPLARRCGEIAQTLSLLKLVWIDPLGGLQGRDGRQRSFVELDELDELLATGAVEPARQPLVREIRAMLQGGVTAVNLCTLEGLADELFTYAGSGTLFTRVGYTEVRALALDEFGAANDLITRGVEEGFLVHRSDDELDRVLANAFGVFVEGRHLAGIGALLPGPDGRSGEIASLYTLTRFVGGGVGEHLIGFALERAAERGCECIYACTTTPRVEAFFTDYGFRNVDASELPPEKWRGYSAERRARVRCLRRDVKAD